MVHFPGFARPQLWIHWGVIGFYPSGFPHSEIPGSKPACGSPRLIAACHVLHRLLLPRHPPCALSSLTIKFTRHTAASLPAFRIQLCQLSAVSPQQTPHPVIPSGASFREAKRCAVEGPCVWFVISSKTTTHRANSMGLSACSSHGITASRLKSLAPDKSGTRNLKMRNSPAHQQASL